MASISWDAPLDADVVANIERLEAALCAARGKSGFFFVGRSFDIAIEILKAAALPK